MILLVASAVQRLHGLLEVVWKVEKEGENTGKCQAIQPLLPCLL